MAKVTCHTDEWYTWWLSTPLYDDDPTIAIPDNLWQNYQEAEMGFRSARKAIFDWCKAHDIDLNGWGS